MADISIEFIGKQLQNIQAELREMKFAAEVERRNTRSAFDNLVAEVGVKLGTFEAMIEHRLGTMDERLGTMDERLGTMDGQLENLKQQLGEGLGSMQSQLGRIEQLLMSRGGSS